jgi:hypothetical protein
LALCLYKLNDHPQGVISIHSQQCAAWLATQVGVSQLDNPHNLSGAIKVIRLVAEY